MSNRNPYQPGRVAIVLFGLVLPVLVTSVHADPAEVQKLIASGDLNQALRMTNAELAQNADDVSYRFLKGLILTRQEKLEQARDIFIGITRTNPELPEPYNNLAVIYAAMGDFDQARQALEQAINTHPAYATAHENIGDIYAKLASQAYNQALELDRENNTAKAKLSLVNELFSMPQTIVKKPATLVASSEAPVNKPVEAPPVPVTELSTPPASVVQVQTVEDSASLQPAIPVREQPAPQTRNAPVGNVQSDLIPVATIKQAVIDWSVVWSAQDVNGYLSFYAGDFIPPDGRPLEQWRELRRQRLSRAGSIKVTIADLVVEMTGTTTAKATFTQSYQSNVYSDRVKKTLILKLENNRWLISRELTS